MSNLVTRYGIILSSCFFYTLIVFSCVSPSEYMGAKRLKWTNTECGKKLYLSQNLVHPDIEAYVSDNKIEEVKLIGRKYIDPESDLVFNESRFLQHLQESFPEANVTGVVMLAWEGKHYKNLAQEKDTVALKRSSEALIAVIKSARSIRPNLKYGYYAIPGRRFWNRDAQWKEQTSHLEKLTTASDVLFPSLYLLYSDQQVSKNDNKEYAEDNVIRALALGSKYEIPVYPVFWHRYATGNKELGLKLIPVDEAREHLGNILATGYSGQTPAGLVWWGADRYFFNIKRPEILNEIAEGEEFEDYFGELFFNYLGMFNDALTKACQK